MVAPAHPCDTNWLRLLIDDQLPHAALEPILRHLDHCDACRDALQNLAAPEHWWRATHESLARPVESCPWPSWTGAADGTLPILEPGTESGNPLLDPARLSGRMNADQELAMRLRVQDQVHGAPDQADRINQHEEHGNEPIAELDFLEPSDNPAMLGRLGEYEVLEVVGRGGMGVVLKGYDRELNRYVAIKTLATHLAGNAAARKRFAREAQAAAAVVHQHVVAIHAVNANHRTPYLVMTHVPGESLEERITRSGPLHLVDILRIGMQVAEGLAAAHAQGLVHRDIKPANILLERNVERVLLTDFGLARAVDDASLTHSGVIAGTPQYMSPEQARGDAVDHRTDLFSLGSVLYAMCTGHAPFRAETTLAVLRRICESAPRSICSQNPEIPCWLEGLIARLHERDPARRCESAHQVAQLLRQCLAHVQQPTSERLPQELRRGGLLCTLKSRRGLSIVVAVTGLFAWFAGSAMFDLPTKDNSASHMKSTHTAESHLLETDEACVLATVPRDGPAEANLAGSGQFFSGPHDSDPGSASLVRLSHELSAIERELHELERFLGLSRPDFEESPHETIRIPNE